MREYTHASVVSSCRTQLEYSRVFLREMSCSFRVEYNRVEDKLLAVYLVRFCILVRCTLSSHGVQTVIRRSGIAVEISIKWTRIMACYLRSSNEIMTKCCVHLYCIILRIMSHYGGKSA